jgi:hypothetical protein
VSAVSDESNRIRSAGLDHASATLDRQGYALTNDLQIGLPEKFRENFQQTYFNSFTLRHDDGDWPEDRQRARDVVRYEWRDDRLRVREHETITITDRAGIAGKRDHSRVWLLSDPQAEDLVRRFISLVPRARRQREGTFGVNLFRTFTNVVEKPHHDDEEFVILYVLDRMGGGAESYLYQPADVPDTGQSAAEPVLSRQLNPGEILVFEDKLFKHGATPLERPPDGEARRDVLICTVDYRSTYLDPATAA